MLHLTLFMVLVITFVLSSTINLYVSPDGSNKNNGSSPNDPFETLDYTQNYIQQIKQNNTQNSYQFVVDLMNGTFHLSKPLKFTTIDSGYSSTNNIIYQSFNINNPAIISSGSMVSHSCFKQINSTTNGINIYQCRYTAKNDLRSIRINNKRAIPSRYPKLSLSENIPPYVKGWLFIESSVYLNNSQYLIGINNDQLLPKMNEIKEGNIHIFPTESWINCEISIKSLTNDTYLELITNNSLTYFIATCPNHHCDNNKVPSSIGTGNRFYFYNITTDIIPINVAYEWYYDYVHKMIYIAIPRNEDIMKTNVIVPNAEYILSLNNVEYVEFNNVIFMDSDYTAYGFQAGFNHGKNPKLGVPNDDAMQITNSSSNIIIKNCQFLELSGCGIVLSYNANNILISNNTFKHLGQSGISLIGNNTVQPSNIIIENNTILYVGEILASAGGVYGSTVSNSIFRYNNITFGSRWGIALRSDQTTAESNNNTISYNIIKNIGLKTNQCGGIGLTGNAELGLSGNNIYHNCIKNAIGMDTDPVIIGRFLTPFWVFGIHLDNYASGWYIYGNILDTNVLAGIWIHGGHSNWIENNILYNASEITYNNHHSFGQLAIGEMKNGALPINTTFLRNVYFYYNKTSKLIFNLGGQWNASYFNQSDYNLFYNPLIKIQSVNMTDFTPVGPTWNEWINGNNYQFDQHSIIDENPQFVDVTKGNFNFNANSPLHKLNFQQIPSYISSNC